MRLVPIPLLSSTKAFQTQTILMWSVWSVVVEWRERRVAWRKVVEGKEKKEWKTKNTNPIATL